MPSPIPQPLPRRTLAPKALSGQGYRTRPPLPTFAIYAEFDY
jgi:hypothetical protein